MTTVEQLVLELAPPPESTFGNFHHGGNDAAMGALHDVVNRDDAVLYLWGVSGCGKSHLLRAAVHAARAAGRQAAYLRATLADLPADTGFIALDDVHLMGAAAQTSAFDTFNRLQSTGGVLVCAGNLPVADLPLRDDLRSRLGSGVAMQIKPLSEAEMREVLICRAAELALDLAPGILDYLLARFPRDLGSLVAAIEALDRYSLQTRRAITLPLLRETIKLQMAHH